MDNMNVEDCPLGDLCPVHFRNNEEILDEDREAGRVITYCGEYVVITCDNPDLDSLTTLMKLVLGLEKIDDIQLYETCVLHVGTGAISDLRKLCESEQRSAIRFIQKHSEWDNFKGAHETVLSGVTEGLIDVSKPALPEED